MKIKGKYAHDVSEFRDCEVLIEFGKLQRVKFNSRQLFNTATPSNKLDFDLEKISSDPIELIPSKHNYVLTYTGQQQENCKIYFSLNIIQITKYRLYKYYYSDEAKVLRKDIIKLIFGAILGIIGTLFVQSYNNKSKEENTTQIQTMTKQIKVQIPSKDLETDTIVSKKY